MATLRITVTLNSKRHQALQFRAQEEDLSPESMAQEMLYDSLDKVKVPAKASAETPTNGAHTPAAY